MKHRDIINAPSLTRTIYEVLFLGVLCILFLVPTVAFMIGQMEIKSYVYFITVCAVFTGLLLIGVSFFVFSEPMFTFEGNEIIVEMWGSAIFHLNKRRVFSQQPIEIINYCRGSRSLFGDYVITFFDNQNKSHNYVLFIATPGYLLKELQKVTTVSISKEMFGGPPSEGIYSPIPTLIFAGIVGILVTFFYLFTQGILRTP